MFEKYAGVKVIKLFLENPYSQYYLREIAKKTGLSPSTVKAVTDVLAQKKLVTRKEMGNLVIFKANVLNPAFRQIKIAKSLLEIEEAGLIPALVKQCIAESVTLYGGVARGEDDAKSDIDILVIGNRKPQNLQRYASRLGKEVNVLFYKMREWSKKARENKPFYENIIIDGIPLYGELPVVL